MLRSEFSLQTNLIFVILCPILGWIDRSLCLCVFIETTNKILYKLQWRDYKGKKKIRLVIKLDS